MTAADEAFERAVAQLEEPPPDQDRPTLADRIESQLLDAEELILRPPPSWLIEDILPAGGTSVLFGKPGSSKSFTALDWTICVGMGLPWQGHQVAPGPVIYIAAEGVGGLGIRIQAWKATFNVEKLEGIRFYPGAINLLDPERRAALIEVVSRQQPSLLVIDTMARSMTGGDENSARDVGLVIAAIDACREAMPGLSNLVVHHMDKSGSTYRGSSALEGAAETMIECEDDDGLVTLSCEKQKDAAGFAPIRVRREVIHLDNGLSSCALRAYSRGDVRGDLGENRDQLLQEFLTAFSETGASRATLRTVTKLPDSTYYRALNDLLSAGMLLNVGTDKQPYYKAN